MCVCMGVCVCVHVDVRKGLFVCMFAYSCMYVRVCVYASFLEKSPQLLLYITLTHKYYFRSISIGIMSLPLTDRLDMFYQRDIYFLPSFTLSFTYQPPPIN